MNIKDIENSLITAMDLAIHRGWTITSGPTFSLDKKTCDALGATLVVDPFYNRNSDQPSYAEIAFEKFNMSLAQAKAFIAGLDIPSDTYSKLIDPKDQREVMSYCELGQRLRIRYIESNKQLKNDRITKVFNFLYKLLVLKNFILASILTWKSKMFGK